MSFRLGYDAWVANEAEKVRGVLLYVLDPEETYTPTQILTVLSDLGLDYSNPTYTDIGAVLIAEGTLEEV